MIHFGSCVRDMIRVTNDEHGHTIEHFLIGDDLETDSCFLHFLFGTMKSRFTAFFWFFAVFYLSLFFS